jgi:XRE family transcriptional regulator, regulator of sulfur utilization
MKVGKIIKASRKSNGLKQDQLAKDCDISVTYLSLIESDKKEPSVSTLKAISKRLNIPFPILIFQALTEEDIPKSKISLFKMIKDPIDTMLKSLEDNQDVDPKD